MMRHDRNEQPETLAELRAGVAQWKQRAHERSLDVEREVNRAEAAEDEVERLRAEIRDRESERADLRDRAQKAEAQVARLLEAPFMCDTHMCGSCKGCRAANVRDWVTETETRASKVEAKLSAVRHIATDVLAEPNEALNDILDIIDGRRP